MAADARLSAEWTFADAAMARFNPVGWRGAEGLNEAILQLEQLEEKDSRRPLLLKVPAGVWTPAERFVNGEEARVHLKRVLSSSIVSRSSSSSSGPGRREGPTAEWMFGDGVASARLNPFRWTGSLSLDEAIARLEALGDKDRQRPLLVKVPAGLFSPEQRFQGSADAAAYLRRTLARAKKAAVSWAIELTCSLCPHGEEHRFLGKAPLLDVEEFHSVQLAVDRLNIDEGLCPGGICVVCSKRLDGYVLVFRADMREEVKAKFGLRSLSWKEFAKRRDDKEGYRFGDITRGLLGQLAFLGDVWAARSGRFDGKKLVVVRNGSLDDRYERLGELASGVQGTASLVRRRRTGQEYVAKATDREAGDGLEDIRAELEKMQVLRHPCCAKMVEFLESKPERRAITICEFAQQGDLAKYLSKETPDGRVVASIFKQAMAGIAFLHTSGCVHNDLKPENLLVFASRHANQAPKVVITDYGCARFVVKDQRLKFGDPRYMAPENVRTMLDYLRSDRVVDVELRPAGDVWSMGATLFEMLSKGVIPFLYEPCSLHRMQEEEGIFERLQEGLLAPDEVDILRFCHRDAPPQLVALLPALLEKNEYCRPTAQKVLAHLREDEGEESSRRCIRRVELSVQQHRAFQILFNCMMWRLQSQHVDDLFGVFECFNTSNSGRVSREEFKHSLELFSKDASSVDELFDMADIDGDHSLEFNEFAAISFDWGSMDEAELDKHIQELLEDLSATGASAVTAQELADLFGHAVERNELLELFARIDTRSTGLMEATDLRSFLQHHRASAHKPVLCEVPVK